MDNKFYVLRNFDLFPSHMLTDENTMCVCYRPHKDLVIRVYPEREFKDMETQAIVLVNPKQEDLTCLMLLGIKHSLITNDIVSANYEAVYNTGVFYLGQEAYYDSQ